MCFVLSVSIRIINPTMSEFLLIRLIRCSTFGLLHLKCLIIHEDIKELLRITFYKNWQYTNNSPQRELTKSVMNISKESGIDRKERHIDSLIRENFVYRSSN